jgi:NAD(P)-dependent dehydrogenase (short-subunit alcohol dehydrogenase family)
MDILSAYQDRRVVVTGCSSGIGLAVAGQLAQAGAEVLGVDRHPAPEGAVRHFVAADLADQASIQHAAGQIGAGVWKLFNCAGLSGGAADPAVVLRVNFLGLRELTERILEGMPSGGAVASTASAAGRDYLANMPRIVPLVRTNGFAEGEAWLTEHEDYVRERGGYAVSKEALVLYTMDRCLDLASRGIRINVTGPGVTDTPMLADTARLHGSDYLDRLPLPFGRRWTAAEQASVLLYLNSEWASCINGQPIWSDGGTISRRALDTADTAATAPTG